MILVDTSAWIDFFRGARPLADTVDELLAGNAVATCGPVLTEVRRGIRSPTERSRVLPLFDGCQVLTQPDELWTEAGEIGSLLGRRGMTVKTLDLLIATYALAHQVPILTRDQDFQLMRKAGIPLRLASLRGA